MARGAVSFETRPCFSAGEMRGQRRHHARLQAFADMKNDLMGFLSQQLSHYPLLIQSPSDPQLADSYRAEFNQALATLREEILARVESLAERSSHYGAELDVISARLDGLHAKMSCMADANVQQIAKLSQKVEQALTDSETFQAGTLARLESWKDEALAALPSSHAIDAAKEYIDEQIKSMVEQARSMVEVSIESKVQALDAILNHRLDGFASDVSRVQMENVQATSVLNSRCGDFEKRIYSLEDLRDKMAAVTKHTRSHAGKIKVLEDRLPPDASGFNTALGQQQLLINKMDRDVQNDKKLIDELHGQQIECLAKLVALEDSIIQGPTFPPVQDLQDPMSALVDSSVAAAFSQNDEMQKLAGRMDKISEDMISGTHLAGFFDKIQQVTTLAINPSISGVVDRMLHISERVAILEGRSVSCLSPNAH